jgi:hypothetical protein
VKILSESRDVKQYIKKMRSRDGELNANWGTICTPLPMLAADGKIRKIQATNTEGVLRIVQSMFLLIEKYPVVIIEKYPV